MSESRYILVNHADRIEEVEPYLYSHTTILKHFRVARMQFALLETTSFANVDYLVNYQADRLRSWIFGVRVFETLEMAEKVLDIEAHEYGNWI